MTPYDQAESIPLIPHVVAVALDRLLQTYPEPVDLNLRLMEEGLAVALDRLLQTYPEPVDLILRLALEGLAACVPIRPRNRAARLQDNREECQAECDLVDVQQLAPTRSLTQGI